MGRDGRVDPVFSVLAQPTGTARMADADWVAGQFGLVLDDPDGSALLDEDLRDLIVGALQSGDNPELVIPSAAGYAEGTLVGWADLAKLHNYSSPWEELEHNYVLMGHVLHHTYHTHTCFRQQGVGRGGHLFINITVRQLVTNRYAASSKEAPWARADEPIADYLQRVQLCAHDAGKVALAAGMAAGNESLAAAEAVVLSDLFAKLALGPAGEGFAIARSVLLAAATVVVVAALSTDALRTPAAAGAQGAEAGAEHADAAAAAAAADDDDDVLPRACERAWCQLTTTELACAKRLGWSSAADWDRESLVTNTRLPWAWMGDALKFDAQVLGFTARTWGMDGSDDSDESDGSRSDSDDGSNAEGAEAGEEDNDDNEEVDGYSSGWWPDAATDGTRVADSPLACSAVR